jgi:glycolate oxidase iron-sulfur subunit
VCCEAPHDDQGNKAKARKLARTNIEVFERFEGLEVIVSDCAACSGMLKEYRELLAEDEEFAERAEMFSGKVLDVSQWLAKLLPGEVVPEARECAHCTLATYHSPCHLGNAQGVLEEPKSVVKSLPEVRLVPLKDETKCCGSAGIYNITHVEMSRRLLEEKVENILATGAEVVVTGNPGCMLQIQKGLRERGAAVEVKHLTQITLEKLSAD